MSKRAWAVGTGAQNEGEGGSDDAVGFRGSVVLRSAPAPAVRPRQISGTEDNPIEARYETIEKRNCVYKIHTCRSFSLIASRPRPCHSLSSFPLSLSSLPNSDTNRSEQYLIRRRYILTVTLLHRVHSAPPPFPPSRLLTDRDRDRARSRFDSRNYEERRAG